MPAGRFASPSLMPPWRLRPLLHCQTALSQAAPHVGALDVQRAGFDGTGVTVAVLDSGVDYTHRNLGGPGTLAPYAAAAGTRDGDAARTRTDGLFHTAKVIGGFDFIGETWGVLNRQQVGVPTPDPDPLDTRVDGHGTHVADILAGASADGQHRGVAPGASLLAIKVCSAPGPDAVCNGVAILQGVDFALDPNGDGDLSDAADVLNVSLSRPYGQPEEDLAFALANAVRAGAVVTAAGNNGDVATIVGQSGTEPALITVAETHVPGALSPEGVPLAGSMVAKSSRGPTPQSTLIKPEIGAPGAIVSASAGTGSGEQPFGGTSGATPVVADGLLQFGIATFGRRSNPLYPAGFAVEIDVDRDGTPTTTSTTRSWAASRPTDVLE